MSLQKNERIGEAFAFGHVLFYAALPLFIVLSKNSFPPIFFTGMSFFLAGVFLLPFAILVERDRFIPKKQIILPMLIGTSIIVLLYYPLLTYFGQHTSAGNIAILVQAEVFFSFLFFGFLGLEVVTAKRVFGSLFIVMGVIVILFRNFSGAISHWDFLIIALAAIPPLANQFQKIALTGVGPLSLTVIRNIIGGMILVAIAVVFEPVSFGIFEWQNFSLILLNSVLAFGISKWFLFIAYYRIGVAKSIAINAASPAITLFLAFLFLREIPSFEQMLGLIAVSVGVLFVIHKQVSRFEGKVMTGDRIGREIGFPTINLETSAKIPAGVYAVKVIIGKQNISGVMHVGKRPTFGKKEWRTEIHLLEFSQETKSETTVEVTIVKRLRSVKKFASREQLAAQITSDISDAREAFQAPS